MLKEKHLTEIDIPAFLNDTIHRGVKTLPYARFFDPIERQALSKDEDRARNGSPGIGISFQNFPDGLHVVDITPGSPANKSGVHIGDIVTSINGESVVGVDESFTEKFSSAPVGSSLILTIKRGSGRHTFEATLIKEIIKQKPAEAKIIRNYILYTRLANFPESTLGDYIESVQSVRRTGAPIKGVILDLRLNGGGALNAAIGMVALFSGRGKLAMVTLKRGDSDVRRITTNWPDYELPIMHGKDPLEPLQTDNWWHSVPLIVLVDGQSASAAEATAAALKDLGRAKLLGMPTYGKGVAQTGDDLPDGSRLSWTDARNLRPNGCPVEGYGVIPDWLVLPYRGADPEGLLLSYREIDVPHMTYVRKSGPDPFGEIRKQRQRLRDRRTLAKVDNTKSLPLPRTEYLSNRDWEVQQAFNALLGQPVQEVPVGLEVIPTKPACTTLGPT